MHDEQHDVEIRTDVRAGDDGVGSLGGGGFAAAPGTGAAGSGH